MKAGASVGAVVAIGLVAGLVTSVGAAGSATTSTVTPGPVSTVGVVMPTATVLLSDRNPSMFGEVVGLSARVTSAAGTPTGTVDIVDGLTTVCNDVALDADGVASCKVRLSPEVHPLSAAYAGFADFGASSSAPLAQTVRAPRTTVAAGTIDTG